MTAEFKDFLIVPAPSQDYGVIGDRLVPVIILPERYALHLAGTHNVVVPAGFRVALGVPKGIVTSGNSILDLHKGATFLPGDNSRRPPYPPRFLGSLN